MGVSPFSQATAVIRRRRAEVDAAVNRAARSIARVASDTLTADTPVKIGVARSNWVATLDEPFEGVLPAYAPFDDLTHDAAPVERKHESENLEAARAQNRAAFAAFDYIRNRVIFLRNNAGHIGLLNDGHSRQTARGFFERGVAVARKYALTSFKLRA